MADRSNAETTREARDVDKTIPDITTAVADIPDGATVMIGGFGGAGSPVELIHALIDHRPRNLTVVNNNAGTGHVGIAALIEAALARLKPSKADPAGGGRPRKTFGEGPSVALKSGISLQAEEDGKGWLIRLSGKRVDRELVETTMRELEALLSSNLR